VFNLSPVPLVSGHDPSNAVALALDFEYCCCFQHMPFGIWFVLKKNKKGVQFFSYLLVFHFLF
jgi:hypothetical protein